MDSEFIPDERQCSNWRDTKDRRLDRRSWARPLLKERIEGVGRTAVVSGQVADIGTDRQRAPGVAEGAVTVPWVKRRVWGH